MKCAYPSCHNQFQANPRRKSIRQYCSRYCAHLGWILNNRDRYDEINRIKVEKRTIERLKRQPHICKNPKCSNILTQNKLGSRRWCSQKCRYEWNSRNIQKNAPRYKICKNPKCKKEFTCTGRSQKYCSKKCQWITYVNIPKNKKSIRITNRMHLAMCRKTLSDSYIKHILYSLGLRSSDITSKIIELEREQLKLKRLKNEKQRNATNLI